MQILLVDDDYDLVDLLTFALTRAGFGVLQAFDGPSALQMVREYEPDLVVLDVHLGESNGFEVLQELRTYSHVPVIMLTVRTAEDDKITGLDLGADDYLAKPFGHRELLARVRAQLRRSELPTSSSRGEPRELTVGPLAMNVVQHRVTNDGQLLHLTLTEFRLLHYLMTHASAVVSTQVLLRHVWGYEDTSREVVRVTVHRLRGKLGEDPRHPRLLHTVPGVGFMLLDEEARQPAPAG